jgi:hypothetical protein
MFRTSSHEGPHLSFPVCLLYSAFASYCACSFVLSRSVFSMFLPSVVLGASQYQGSVLLLLLHLQQKLVHRLVVTLAYAHLHKMMKSGCKLG